MESRKGGGSPIDPPSRLRVTIFARSLLGLIELSFAAVASEDQISVDQVTL